MKNEDWAAIMKAAAREIIMSESQKAMKIFRADNPLPPVITTEYLDRQLAFINAYLMENVPEYIRKAAV